MKPPNFVHKIVPWYIKNDTLPHMKKLIYCTSVVIFLLSNTASADIDSSDAFDQINNSFSAGFTVMHFNYRENAQEVNSDLPGNIEDYGNAFGLALNFRNVFFQKLYTDLYGEYAVGKLQYDGFLMFPDKNDAYVPSKHKNTNNFANIDMKLGVILLNNTYFQIIPYGGLGFRYWTPDTFHTYYNFKALVGAKLHCALSDNLILSPYTNIGTTLYSHAKAKVYDKTDNYQGKANHKLGNKIIKEFGLEINYRLDHELFVVGTVSHTHFEYKKSAPQTVGTVKDLTEPNSKTNELRFTFGIRYGFM